MVLKDLHNFVLEAISASPSYMKKESIRELVQKIVINKIRSGEVQTQPDLDDLFVTLEMSMSALKMVPVEVFTKLALSKKS